MKLVDLTGKKFGKLTVIKRIEKPKHIKSKSIYWLCRCDCRIVKVIDGHNLREENTFSCGCYNKENHFLKGKAPRNRVYSLYKLKAKYKKVIFSLSKEEFEKIIDENCFYCGKNPSNIAKSRNNNENLIYNGIDRLDNNEGYIKGNIVPCCWECNKAKGVRNKEDFIKWINAVYNNLNK